MAAFLALLLAQSPAFGEAMASAEAAYGNAEFEEALQQLERAQALSTTQADRVQVLLARGQTLARVPNSDAAAAAWEQALSLDASASPPWPMSPKVRASFDKVASSVRRIRGSLVLTPAPAPPRRLKWWLFGGAAGGAVLSAGFAFISGVLTLEKVEQVRVATLYADKAALYPEAQALERQTNVGWVVAGALGLLATVFFALPF